jgi:hypothetical protein
MRTNLKTERTVLRITANTKKASREAAEKPLHHGRPINSSKIVDEFSYNY